jgi:hypothetical protein
MFLDIPVHLPHQIHNWRYPYCASVCRWTPCTGASSLIGWSRRNRVHWPRFGVLHWWLTATYLTI